MGQCGHGYHGERLGTLSSSAGLRKLAYAKLPPLPSLVGLYGGNTGKHGMQ